MWMAGDSGQDRARLREISSSFATQNDVQFKTYELLIYGILIFSDCE